MKIFFLKDNIKKFRDQAKKLEDSDALKEARDKYKTLERETMKGSTVFREKIGEIGGKVKEVIHPIASFSFHVLFLLE